MADLLRLHTGTTSTLYSIRYSLIDFATNTTFSVPACFGEQVIIRRGCRGLIPGGRLLPGVHVARGAYR
jgi:hypothetical protein